jgi:arabinose-5-phosphate isomerase
MLETALEHSKAIDDTSHVICARKVFRLEAKALDQFADSIPADFGPAVEAILAASGRVIVSGVGKSGHVGRKIAATLASTGTPALFVHASEASHGDLGMITKGDICILISNSGESVELVDLVAYARRFKIPLIGISRRSDSTLMRAANLRLLLPEAPEVCAVGMAPTTSTTLTMALGDALAVALMNARGFRSEDFRVFHPGGKLGAQLRRVGQLMHGADALPLVCRNAPMPEVLLEMTSGGFGVAVVTGENGTLHGIVTDGDLRRNIADLMSGTAESFASRDPITVNSDTLAADALATMNEAKITVLLVVDEARYPVGILHMHDLLRAGVA